MSRGINKVMVMGRLGENPQVRKEDENNPIVGMRLATTRQWKDKEGNKKEETTWHSVSLFGSQARFARDYCVKGNMVYVEGYLQSRSWENDAGEKKYDYSIKGERVENYTPKGESVERSGSRSEVEDDDIPYD
tara:strand:+ start:3452 stop:3850 length:399 start_codon:yes stop_codon:yes gene_type:complete